MVALNAPSPRDVTPGQLDPAQAEVGFSDAYRQAQRQKAIAHRDGRRRDPSPEEIREACLAIQEEWSPAERRARAGAILMTDAQRKHTTRQLNRHGYVRSWTPPVCRDISTGKGVR